MCEVGIREQGSTRAPTRGVVSFTPLRFIHIGNAFFALLCASTA